MGNIIQTAIRNVIQIEVRNMIRCKKGRALFALLRIEMRKGTRWRPGWQMNPQHRITIAFIVIGIVVIFIVIALSTLHLSLSSFSLSSHYHHFNCHCRHFQCHRITITFIVVSIIFSIIFLQHLCTFLYKFLCNGKYMKPWFVGDQISRLLPWNMGRDLKGS